MTKVKVVGAGLAGSEAAWQLAQRGVAVELYEMKPRKMTPAHHADTFAELVCSNSFRGDRLENAGRGHPGGGRRLPGSGPAGLFPDGHG